MPFLKKLYLKYIGVIALTGSIIGYFAHHFATKVVIASLLGALYPHGSIVVADKMPIDLASALTNVGLIRNFEISLCSQAGNYFYPHKSENIACSKNKLFFQNTFKLENFYEKHTLQISYSPHQPLVFMLICSLFFLTLTLFIMQFLEKQRKLKSEITEKTMLANLAKQLAHDIRSPLAALNSALFSLNSNSELAKNLIKGSSIRIRDIAEDLLLSFGKHNYKSDEFFSTQKVIQALIEEKQLLNPEAIFEVLSSNKDLILNLNKSYFQRALSNFINNSIESKKNPSDQIKIIFQVSENELTISDNGKGIAADVLARLQKGESVTTKSDGYGIGFQGSRALLENMGLKVSISSTPSIGTQIKINRV